MIDGYYLQEDVFMTPSEAAYRWRIKRNTLIAALNRGKFDDYIREGLTKKFTQHGATEWLVSVRAMRDVFGDEDKVQVFELGNLEGETSEPRSVIYFEFRWLCMTAPGAVITEEIMEYLRACETYEAALELVFDKRGIFEYRSVEDIIGQMPLFGFPNEQEQIILRKNKSRAVEVIHECLEEIEKSLQANNGETIPYFRSCKRLLEDVLNKL